MILYALVCAQEHAFEAWFRSAADFEMQTARGLVTCVKCGSSQVQRGLMAPNVISARSRRSTAQPSVDAAVVPAQTPVTTPQPFPVAIAADPQQKAMLEALVELKRKVTASADYVGTDFAEEARKIHYGEAPERGIYGETTLEEARSLVDEGIEVQPLPVLPDEHN